METVSIALYLSSTLVPVVLEVGHKEVGFCSEHLNTRTHHHIRVFYSFMYLVCPTQWRHAAMCLRVLFVTSENKNSVFNKLASRTASKPNLLCHTTKYNSHLQVQNMRQLINFKST